MSIKTVTLHAGVLVHGAGSIAYLRQLAARRAMIITGGHAMRATGVLDRAETFLREGGAQVLTYEGIRQNPTDAQVLEALAAAREFGPDAFVAIGGGSSIDASKAVMLFYEFPDITFDNVFSAPLPEKRAKTRFVAVPSTSGTASEVTHVTVISFPEKNHQKLAIRAACLRPDAAILDAELPLTMPPRIAAETGMDALTHALESLVNKNGDDFTRALAREAIEGILYWLPVSVREGGLESREKMHHYQCMAGMSFANAGLGMVHGCSHAFGGMYDLPHGLANAVILPYSMNYNRRDPFAAEQYRLLSAAIGQDLIDAVRELSAAIAIPPRLSDTGIAPESFARDFEQLLDNALGGSTAVNPRPVPREDMAKFLRCVYDGTPCTF